MEDPPAAEERKRAAGETAQGSAPEGRGSILFGRYQPIDVATTVAGSLPRSSQSDCACASDGLARALSPLGVLFTQTGTPAGCVR